MGPLGQLPGHGTGTNNSHGGGNTRERRAKQVRENITAHGHLLHEKRGERCCWAQTWKSSLCSPTLLKPHRAGHAAHTTEHTGLSGELLLQEPWGGDPSAIYSAHTLELRQPVSRTPGRSPPPFLGHRLPRCIKGHVALVARRKAATIPTVQGRAAPGPPEDQASPRRAGDRAGVPVRSGRPRLLGALTPGSVTWS